MGTHEGEVPMGMTEDVGDTQAEADRWNSKVCRAELFDTHAGRAPPC
ncbi:expressed unknown protein [Ectocarpus siliculosus]|uniref:Uncharacterized protein n=1 Tax=Ectocarpus siliculosus TaxID=2880 RepID=D7G3I1_ECTSI|nr:expressed unknown protein [Ectocarpus siliculosus]|eukprot:CBJ26979.1 expressed unknown protein [Ectocarpus siliculosus]